MVTTLISTIAIILPFLRWFASVGPCRINKQAIVLRPHPKLAALLAAWVTDHCDWLAGCAATAVPQTAKPIPSRSGRSSLF